MKQRFKRISNKLFAVFFALLMIASATILPTGSASAGSIPLQTVLDKLRQDCSGMERDTDQWKTCEGYQLQLNKIAACTDKMFENTGNTRVVGSGHGEREVELWSFKKAEADRCQTLINQNNTTTRRATFYLSGIRRECKNMERDRVRNEDSDRWKKCEQYQFYLTAIGCSGSMFAKTGSKTTGSGHGEHEVELWSFKKAQADQCQKTISNIKKNPSTKAGDGLKAQREREEQAAAAKGQGTEEIQCEASAFTIAWVMCAAVEFGANFVNWFFKEFLTPLLENIPVSTDPRTGSFNAWQAFRVIANILLIASMFAVVYAQARGEK